MSISTEINRLTTAKNGIKQAIESKNVTVPSTTRLDGMAALISSIQTGSGIAQETGTWTPILYGSDSGISLPALGTFTGVYVKTGNMVFVTCELNVSMVGGELSGDVVIGGLPFSAAMPSALSIAYEYLSEWIAGAFLYDDTIYLYQGDVYLPGSMWPATTQAFDYSNGVVSITGCYKI